MARKSLKPVTRFEVFKRDGFACQYCGQKPPAVVLQVDHIIPVARGGTDVIDNLLTACQPCNQGKAARPLEVMPESLSERAAEMQEKRDQLRAYERMLKKEKKRVDESVEKVRRAFSTGHLGQVNISPPSRKSVERFLTLLPETEVIDAALLAANKNRTPKDTFRYFCGVCWSKIKGRR